MKTIKGPAIFLAQFAGDTARELTSKDQPDLSNWAHAFSLAVQTVSDLGGARVGDRTMIDAPSPAADALMAAASTGASG